MKELFERQKYIEQSIITEHCTQDEFVIKNLVKNNESPCKDCPESRKLCKSKTPRTPSWSAHLCDIDYVKKRRESHIDIYEDGNVIEIALDGYRAYWKITMKDIKKEVYYTKKIGLSNNGEDAFSRVIEFVKSIIGKHNVVQVQFDSYRLDSDFYEELFEEIGDMVDLVPLFWEEEFE